MNSDSLEMKDVDEAEGTTLVAPLLEKKRQVIPYDDAKILLRAQRLQFKRLLGSVLVCFECQQAKRGEVCQWAREETSGQLILQCGCSVRVFEGVTKL